MKSKFLPFYSLAFSAGLLFSASDSNAENIFTRSMSKAGSAVVGASKTTGSVAVKTAKIITPDSFFIEGSNLEVGAGAQIYGIQYDSPYDAETVSNDASSAIRAGIGYDIDSNKELRISYFKYESKDNDSTNSQGNSFYSYDDKNDYGYYTADAEYKHKVNSIDIDIATTKIVSNNLNLQFSGGLKYANYERDINVTYYGNDFDNTGNVTSVKSKFRGFGPKAGIEADYKIISGFSVYGGASITIIAGTSEVQMQDYDSEINLKDNLVTPIVSGDFGVKWSKENIIKNSDFAIKVGYRVENWQSVVNNATRDADDAHYNTIIADNEDLSFSGAYLRTTFSF